MTASAIEELCTRIQKVVTVDVKVMTMKMDRIKENAETIQEGGIEEEKIIFAATRLGSLA